MQIPVKSPAATPVRHAARRMQANVSPITYYSGYSPFLNWVRKAANPVMNKTAGSVSFSVASRDAGYFDDNGNVAVNCPADSVSVRYFFHSPSGNVGENMAGEDFTAFYDGVCSGFTPYSLSITNIVHDTVNKKVTFKAANSNCYLSFNISDRTDPPRNVRIVQTRYLTDTVLDGVTYPGWNSGGEFNPHWLHEMKKLKRLRFMDPMGTNSSEVVNYSQIADDNFVMWGRNITDSSQGITNLKAGMSLAAIGRIANQTGCEVHICIPHGATNTCVDAMATAMKAATTNLVWWEYSNEVWNVTLGSQNAYAATHASDYTGLSAGNYYHYAGYRGAECMKRISDIYADRTRWRGVFATQSANVACTTGMKFGFDQWKTNTGSSLNMPDLFDELHVTSYFGEIVGHWVVSAIAKGVTTDITFTSASGLAINDEILLGYRKPNGTDGTLMTQIYNGVYGKVTAINGNTVTTDIDSSSFTTGSFGNGECYAAPAKWFRLLDESRRLHGVDPATYPSDYTYMNQQLAKMQTTGSNDFGMIASTGQAASLNQFWTPSTGYWYTQKALAVSYGLAFSQYEGGLHMLGGTLLSGRTGLTPSQNPIGDRFLEIMQAYGHSEECAAVYSESYRRFYAMGGVTPSKYYEAGQDSFAGTWGAIRSWPSQNNPSGDMSTPVWKAVVANSRVDFKP